MKYSEARYAYGRLDRTFIVHEDKIVIVNGYDEYEDKLLIQTKSGRADYVKVDELNLTPMRLGYVNFKDTCCFTCRIPMRRDWKQGVRVQNLFRKVLDEHEEQLAVRNHTDLFILEDTCFNRYPSYEQSLSNVEETHRASAFSRNFSVNETGKIVYRSTNYIGKVEDERSLCLDDDYLFLKERLQDELVHPSSPDTFVEIRNKRNV